MVNLKELSVEQLKVLAYDLSVQVNVARANVTAVTEEINNRPADGVQEFKAEEKKKEDKPSPSKDAKK